MSSTHTECNATKDRKSKRGSRKTSARPRNALDNMMVGTASEPCIPSSSSLPSTSSLALPLQPALPGSSPEAGPSFMEQTTPLSDSKESKQQKIQRKFCGGKTHSMQTRNQRKMATAAAAQVEPLRLDDRSIGAEVVDLTCETSEPLVVDLTHNDSVVLVGESGQQPNREFRYQPLPDSLILSSDDDDDSRPTESNAVATRKLPREERMEEFASSGSSGTVRCPICIKSYAEIVQSGRLIMSTKCGHIFCSLCLRNSLEHANFCPTCRKELTQKDYHPVYI